MLKKFISVILAITMIAGSMGVAFADDESVIAAGIIEGGELSGEEATGDQYNIVEAETDGREATVKVSGGDVTSGDPVFQTEGEINPLDPAMSDGYNYYWSDIWDVNGKSAFTDGATWNTGWAYPYHDNDGTLTSAGKRSGACQRVVSYDNETPADYADDVLIGGLYCIDISTGIPSSLKYRAVNIEDAVDEGYFTESDVSHIRAVVMNGYSWAKLDENGDVIPDSDNLEEMKEMLNAAQKAGKIDSGIDFDQLTANQAATATNMAIWQYGNRYEQRDDIVMSSYSTAKSKAAAASDDFNRIDAVYAYLISLTDDNKETQVINEEKFIDDMSIEIGGLAEGVAANEDSDDTNDVYNVGIKFSLKSAIDEIKDNLVAKIKNTNGDVVKKARIAGADDETDPMDRAVVLEIDGKIYYLIDGIQLAENEDSEFTVKLEGQQYLKEGVYVFESEHPSAEDAIEHYVNYLHNVGCNDTIGSAPYLTEDNLKDEQASYEKLMEIFGSEEAIIKAMSEYSPEDLIAAYKDDGIEDVLSVAELEFIRKGNSQNFVGKFSGNYSVDVSMKVGINFSVDEPDTQEASASAGTGIGGNDDPGEPPVGGGGSGTAVKPESKPETVEDSEVPLADLPDGDVPLGGGDGLDELPEEEVPLADVPFTGDSAVIYAAALAAALGAVVISLRKKEEKK